MRILPWQLLGPAAFSSQRSALGRQLLAVGSPFRDVLECFHAIREGFLVVNLRFGERDGPLVGVFFHLMLLLFAVVLLLFALLRFEANFRFSLFGSYP
jgi:hypothetical protein